MVAPRPSQGWPSKPETKHSSSNQREDDHHIMQSRRIRNEPSPVFAGLGDSAIKYKKFGGGLMIWFFNIFLPWKFSCQDSCLLPRLEVSPALRKHHQLIWMHHKAINSIQRKTFGRASAGVDTESMSSGAIDSPPFCFLFKPTQNWIKLHL